MVPKEAAQKKSMSLKFYRKSTTPGSSHMRWAAVGQFARTCFLTDEEFYSDSVH
jgi:hypothetical protein